MTDRLAASDARKKNGNAGARCLDIHTKMVKQGPKPGRERSLWERGWEEQDGWDGELDFMDDFGGEGMVQTQAMWWG